MNTRLKTTAVALILSIQMSGSTQSQETVESGHIAVENPANLTKSQANKLYASLRQRMAENYGSSQLSAIENYQSWNRYNSAPYLSATHGQRFVNSYANDKASAYGKLPKGEKYPVGSVFAKDSMTITDDDKVFPGAIFVMEKLVSGSNPQTADWRYLMVLPDGTQYGDTTGAEAAQVEYCHACHLAKADEDFVFFVPEEFQISN